MKYLIYLIVFIATATGVAQDNPTNRPATRIDIFNDVEKELLATWLGNAIQDMDFSEEELVAYQEIWKKYSAQFDQIGNLSEGWSKTALIDKFNSLIDMHYKELEEVLTPDHFKAYQREFKILVWNANLRLEKL